jgi:hypothetical protein
VTGLIYLDTTRPDFLQLLNLTDEPLTHLDQKQLRPSESALEEVMEELRWLLCANVQVGGLGHAGHPIRVGADPRRLCDPLRPKAI